MQTMKSIKKNEETLADADEFMLQAVKVSRRWGWASWEIYFFQIERCSLFANSRETFSEMLHVFEESKFLIEKWASRLPMH